MKVKVIPYDHATYIRKHFFLLMIAPLLLGLLISLMNFAYADWNQDDPLLHVTPTKQGWTQIQIYKSPSKIQKVNKKIVRDPQKKVERPKLKNVKH